MYYNTKASGARIRELRIAKNLTQDELAEHFSVPMRRMDMSKTRKTKIIFWWTQKPPL